MMVNTFVLHLLFCSSNPSAYKNICNIFLIGVVGYTATPPTPLHPPLQYLLMSNFARKFHPFSLNPGYAPRTRVKRASLCRMKLTRCTYRLFQWRAFWKPLKTWSLRWPGATKSGKGMMFVSFVRRVWLLAFSIFFSICITHTESYMYVDLVPAVCFRIE